MVSDNGSPQQGAGAEQGSGSKATEAENLLAFGQPTKVTKFAELSLCETVYLTVSQKNAPTLKSYSSKL